MIRVGYFHESGEFSYSLSCMREGDMPEAPEGMLAVVLGPDQAGQMYLLDGVVYQRPPQPSPAHTWDQQLKQWTISLSNAKAAAWERIKAERSARLTNPLITPHGTFDCDPLAQNNIIKAALQAQTLHAMGQASGVTFTTADNVRRTFTMEQMVEVAILMGAREQEIYNAAAALRDAIEACTTVEQTEAVLW